MRVSNNGWSPFERTNQFTLTNRTVMGTPSKIEPKPEEAVTGYGDQLVSPSAISYSLSVAEKEAPVETAKADSTVHQEPNTTTLSLSNSTPVSYLQKAAALEKAGVQESSTGSLIMLEPGPKQPETDSLSWQFRSLIGFITSTPTEASSKAARVGVPGNEIPDLIPRVPNLNPQERLAETRFATAYEKHGDAMASELRSRIKSGEIGDGPNIFSTDDAKLLSPDYNPQGVSGDESKAARATYNLAVHQTANALAKKAFIQELDEIAKKPGEKQVLVTSGGVGAGKSYALGNVERAKDLADKVDAIWDSAGEQNATELPWILSECKKRGIKPTFVHVHQDPMGPWTNLERGVIPRAQKSGRMVDARLYADSHVEGAKNFNKFFQAHKDEAEFIIIDNTSKPCEIPSLPAQALNLSSEFVYSQALDFIGGLQGKCSDAIYAAGHSRSVRVWGPAQE